eukprot:CAMPEP_0117421526 /NCGR_PEP_ID=MMETSP0758-20121206/2585_1 /TAXON_ID=63605 /ORGANISM="Percolomonas cosmopolitus, Strain AE-1 (ATCC 50343)" /LENGTH=305 /DNA_ID=CAMNT_0005203673 /DNA_START=1465 /DNA_END=2382 /DNA_ORIENTATION=+
MKQTQFETRLVEIENRRSDSLLKNIFPLEYKEDFFKKRAKHLPLIRPHKWATCVITDVVNFTSWCYDRSSKQVVHVLNDHFSGFDEVIAKYEMVKIKTIGDDKPHNREMTLNAAQELLDVMESSNTNLKQNLTVRVGIAEGPVYITLYGSSKVTFDCFGNAVTKAELLEQTAPPSRIHVSQEIAEHCKEFSYTSFTPDAPASVIQMIPQSYLLSDAHHVTNMSYQTTIQSLSPAKETTSKLVLEPSIYSSDEPTIDKLSSNYSLHTEVKQQRDGISRSKRINLISRSYMCTFNLEHDLGMKGNCC